MKNEDRHRRDLLVRAQDPVSQDERSQTLIAARAGNLAVQAHGDIREVEEKLPLKVG